MIHILAGSDAGEARRLQASMASMGMAAQLAEQVPTDDNGDLLLAHVSMLEGLGESLPQMRVIAFGGDDRAAQAIDVVRAGALDYLPIGAQNAKISSALSPLLKRERQRGPSLAQNRLCARSPVMQGIVSLAAKVARRTSLC